MSEAPRAICGSEDIVEGGPGVRFELQEALGGFAVRFAGVARAYVNRCPHLGTELDWQPGEFFTEGGSHLVCSTHGALFQPYDGHCVAGPCRGASLEALVVRERNGRIFLYNEAPAAPANHPQEKP